MQAKRIPTEAWLAAGFLAALSALAYLSRAGALGFYTDDWYVIWGGTQRGLGQIVDFYLVDRPFMGLPFAATFALLGNSPLAWHVYAALLRFLGGLAALWLLRQLWPEERLATTLAAGLFVVYPGFLSQPKAVTYQLNILALDLGLLSLGMMAAAVRAQRKWARVGLTLAAVGAALLCYAMFEYMIGLEGVRLLVLATLFWGGAAQKTTQRALRTLRPALPYLGGALAFLIWRVFFFTSARAATDLGGLKGQYLADPLGMGLRLVVETFKDMLESLFLAWGVPLYNLTQRAETGVVLQALGVGLLGGLALFGYGMALRVRGLDSRDKEPAWTRGALWMGAAGTLAALLPVLLAGRDVYFADAYDHYSLQAGPMVGLFLAAAACAWFRPKGRILAGAVLIAAGLAAQNANAAAYSRAWEYQRQLWWQLSWRAPDLKDGTVIVPVLPAGYRLREGYEVWSPANLIYNPGGEDLRVVGMTLDDQTLLQALRRETFGEWFRRVEYTVETRSSLVVSLPPGGACLHVMEGARGEISSREEALVRLVAPLSDASRIAAEAAAHIPPAAVFGREPEHGWCYYYQRASLARQRQDWQAAAALGDEAQERGLAPADISEWMPFYEAYAVLERREQADYLGGLLRTDAAFLNTYCTAQRAQLGAQAAESYLVHNLCGNVEAAN